MIDNRSLSFLDGAVVGDGNQVGKAVLRDLSHAPLQAEGAGAVERGQAQDLPGRHAGVGPGKGLHLGEQIQFRPGGPNRRHTGHAVRAEADIDTRNGEFAVKKWFMPKIGVTAGAMDDAGLRLGQGNNVAGLQIIGVDGQKPFAHQAATADLFNGRSVAAVRHVALAFEPIEEMSPAMRVHVKFVRGLRHMHRDPPAIS